MSGFCARMAQNRQAQSGTECALGLADSLAISTRWGLPGDLIGILEFG